MAEIMLDPKEAHSSQTLRIRVSYPALSGTSWSELYCNGKKVQSFSELFKDCALQGTVDVFVDAVAVERDVCSDAHVHWRTV